MKERIGYFDFLRGIAILVVIGIHSYYVVPFDSAINVMRNFIRELLNFAVPLFLAISGYFIGSKSLNNRGDYVAFLKRQVPRVYLPMLIWSLPILTIGVVGGMSYGQVLGKWLIGSAFGPYYFVILIIQLLLSTPCVCKGC